MLHKKHIVEMQKKKCKTARYFTQNGFQSKHKYIDFYPKVMNQYGQWKEQIEWKWKNILGANDAHSVKIIISIRSVKLGFGLFDTFIFTSA